MFNKDDVNVRNTRTWINLNDNTKSEANRKVFLDTYGGAFDKGKEGYIWKEEIAQHTEPKIIEIPEPEPKQEESGRFTVTFPNGKEQVVSKMTEFCKEQDLNKSALYAIMRGERKRHKGFRIRKSEENNDVK
jgi:hypothetical protein|tara:strand:+ start:379 stop:774 length:396 start_codon:yes stop_codon:yes gene_type:complete